MHAEAQSARHAILDLSLTDMLLKLRNCEKLQQEQTDKINNHQVEIDRLKINKEQQENNIHQLNVFRQQMGADTSKLTTKLSNQKCTLDSCTKKIETCKEDIKKQEDMIKELQDQSVTKQNEIDDLITKIGELEIRYEQHDKIIKEHEEHLTMHGGLIKTCEKSIQDIKQKLQETDDTSGKIDLVSSINFILSKHFTMYPTKLCYNKKKMFSLYSLPYVLLSVISGALSLFAHIAT